MQWLSIRAVLPQKAKIILAVLPFLLLLGTYVVFSEARHAENEADKVLPTLSTLKDSVARIFVKEDRRSGEILLWKDTAASLKRLAYGLIIASCAALFIGLNMGMYPYIASTLSSFVVFLSMIPPLAILPILFIIIGIGELGKIALIVFGTLPLITRDVQIAVKNIPVEQITKAQSMGASHWGVTYKIVLPQIMPRLLTSIRLSLGAAWLFVIAAEAISATEGLGYRIFLVRRYLSMDIIIPYVIWITFLGFLIDLSLRLIIKHRYAWATR